MKAKKSLGQHFLKSERALDSMVSAGEINSKDIVLEIGPGHGALTIKLLEKAKQVIAVEKDDELFEELSDKFENEIASGKLQLLHKDILDTDPKQFGEYKLVANIPYNITGSIIRNFLSSENQPVIMVLLVQKEVAERIVTRDGKESILSISVKAYGIPQLVEKVKAGSFVPAPKVDSAILAVGSVSKDFFKGFTEEYFFSLVHAGFSSKRKKVSSNISKVIDKEKVAEVFKKLNLSDNIRAEELDTETWGKIAMFCQL